jgi:adenosylmethionine-8-amino-7-oxononanoate aminotransferase
MGALALTGRPELQRPFEAYLAQHVHTPHAALEELDRVLDEVGGETVAAYVCEPVGAAARPAFSPPPSFWEGLDERRERYGFLIGFDEIVTGMGRTGSWFAYQQLPIEPDVVSAGKGLGAGYFPLAAMFCRQHVFDALAEGSREFEHGHTWDGAPLPCAIGLAVLAYLESHALVERVRDRGPSLRVELEAAIGGLALVREVRGRGFLLGVELVDPRDGQSLFPSELDVAQLVDQVAYEHGVLVTSSHSTADGFALDQTLLAPAYTATDAELAEMITRFAAALTEVESLVRERLG